MKKTILFLFLIFLLLPKLNSQEIKLSFSANHSCSYKELNRVFIENLSRGGSKIIYFPDTTLILYSTGFDNSDVFGEELAILKNYPNPFSEKTNIDVYLPKHDLLVINAYDIQGRNVASYKETLERGIHSFSFYGGNNNNYIVTAKTGGNYNQKLITQITSQINAAPRLQYNGLQNKANYEEKSAMFDLPFLPGDELKFICYVDDGFGNFDYEIITDQVYSSTDYFFDIANETPGKPSEIDGKSLVLANKTGLEYAVTDVGHTYIWSVPDDWEITSGSGTNAITADAGSNGGTITVRAESNCGLSEERTLDVDVYFNTSVPFSTSFELEDSWDNPGGSWNSYNEKTYTDKGWVFHSTMSVRGTTENETYNESPYSFRDRDVFRVKNSYHVNRINGFSFMLRDWMENPGRERDIKISYNGGDSWETIATITKEWFGNSTEFKEFEFSFGEYRSFGPEELIIKVVGGGESNTGRINIGHFEAFIYSSYEIHFIDVGQGDAIFITTMEKSLLIDGGPGNSNVSGYIAGLGYTEIDYVVATHPHADHIGGLINVFNTTIVGEVIDPGTHHTTVTYNNYMAAISNNNITHTTGRVNMERDLGYGAFLKIYHPPEPIPSYSNFLNNASMVIKVILGEVAVLLTGDIEQQGEADVLSAFVNELNSTVLKVAHHGSNSSSTIDFLQAVQPEVSVIMCAAGNSYGHPHQPTLDRLDGVGSEIFRTDLHGNIIITTDGFEYEVTTEFVVD